MAQCSSLALRGGAVRGACSGAHSVFRIPYSVYTVFRIIDARLLLPSLLSQRNAGAALLLASRCCRWQRRIKILKCVCHFCCCCFFFQHFIFAFFFLYFALCLPLALLAALCPLLVTYYALVLLLLLILLLLLAQQSNGRQKHCTHTHTHARTHSDAFNLKL